MKTRKNRKQNRKQNRKKKTIKVYTAKDYKSSDGMLTSVWGPSIWHYLHTMSFNYPVHPTRKEKTNYRKFVLGLVDVLPCKYCRINLKNNFKKLPLKCKDMKNRNTFSRYVYKLHELVNKMLGKKSGLSYCDIRERYEHFRSRCTLDVALKQNDFKSLFKKTRKNRKHKKEMGCTESLYGKKSKCVIKIVPQETNEKTFQIDKRCKKTR